MHQSNLITKSIIKTGSLTLITDKTQSKQGNLIVSSKTIGNPSLASTQASGSMTRCAKKTLLELTSLGMVAQFAISTYFSTRISMSREITKLLQSSCEN